MYIYIHILGNENSFKPHWWNDGEPIWVTAENQNVTTATMFWPGSEVEIHGTRPSYYVPYNGSMTFTARIDKIVEWLQIPDSTNDESQTQLQPQLILGYFDEPDLQGHSHGPYSTEVHDAICSVDNALNYLLDEIDELKLSNYGKSIQL